MIIGVTGTLGAGKGTIVEFLKQKGFKHYSVRDFLVAEMNRLGVENNRDNMVKVANHLREKNSPSYIAEKLYEQAEKDGGNCVIESLRAIGEVDALRKKGEFFLFAIDADIKSRYSRIILRQSTTDNISFDEFVENEKREMNSNDPNKQNLSKCIAMADFIFQNNSSIQELFRKVGEALVIISSEGKIVEEKRDAPEVKMEKVNVKEIHQRPSWDEYFMKIMDAVATRATCDRGRSGCVIAKDKQILVTGYVGSPIGIPHCDEIGHQIKTTIHEDGSKSDHCVRTTHAEQNAICQAAKLGIPINGATLYCRMTPCSTCAKMIINSGIKKVVCQKKYHQSKESEELFSKAGVELFTLNNEVEQYKNQ